MINLSFLGDLNHKMLGISMQLINQYSIFQVGEVQFIQARSPTSLRCRGSVYLTYLKSGVSALT